ncbi:Chromosome partition protein Smc [Carpediemonas membranifera]|uniref:Chromosome partition protein Smc n=1 Tax=Carpediemonas membranifera TaxID=201153 RepID=A0A8J6EBA7_9EUKA|nr:Chromosome partition protein Smc [Carpediemonas membranifera]|eukprot:KAG9396700.1 Chromosome partition protein Smc [Carpediemonas membranifera]
MQNAGVKRARLENTGQVYDVIDLTFELSNDASKATVTITTPEDPKLVLICVIESEDVAKQYFYAFRNSMLDSNALLRSLYESFTNCFPSTPNRNRKYVLDLTKLQFVRLNNIGEDSEVWAEIVKLDLAYAPDRVVVEHTLGIIEALHGDIDDGSKREAEAQEKIRGLQDAHRRLQVSLTTLEDTLGATREKLGATESSLEKQTAKVAALSAENDRLSVELQTNASEARSEVERARAELEHVNEAKKKLEQQYAALKTKHHGHTVETTAELQSLREEVSALSQERAGLQNQLAEAQYANSEQRRQMDAHDRATQDLEARAAGLQDEVDRLTGDVAQLTSELEAARADHQTADATRTELEERGRQQEVTVADLESQVISKSHELEVVRAQLDGKDGELARMAEFVRETIASLHDDAQESQRFIKELQDQIRQQEATMQRLEEDNRLLRDRAGGFASARVRTMAQKMTLDDI